MSSRLPVRVDPWRLADQGKTLEGRYPLAEMPRLAPLLADTEAEVAFRLSFGRDPQGRPVVRGEVEAVLSLICQRCLEPLAHTVRSRFVLGLVTSIAEAKKLPDTYESLLAEEDTVSPRDLVEEELLLALPAVPRHAERCSPTSESGGARAEREDKSAASPFAVLARLGRRSDED